MSVSPRQAHTDDHISVTSEDASDRVCFSTEVTPHRHHMGSVESTHQDVNES